MVTPWRRRRDRTPDTPVRALVAPPADALNDILLSSLMHFSLLNLVRWPDLTLLTVCIVLWCRVLAALGISLDDLDRS